MENPTSPTPQTSHPIVFFDGVCGLCNAFIDFLFRIDIIGKHHVAALQGETATRYLSASDIQDLKTIVLWQDGKLYRQSAAVLQIFYNVGGWWKVVALLRFIPRPLRDLGYNVVARLRYRLFGRKDSCRLPTPAERSRFLL